MVIVAIVMGNRLCCAQPVDVETRREKKGEKVAGKLARQWEVSMALGRHLRSYSFARSHDFGSLWPVIAIALFGSNGHPFARPVHS